MRSCKTGEVMKAISQNFGHEHIATTFSSYGNYDPQRLSEILKNLDFSGKPSESLEDKVDRLLERFENYS